jgi:anti-anti-sigma factor
MLPQRDTVVVLSDVDDATVLIYLTGDLDLRAEPDLTRAISHLHAAGHRGVVVDLAELTFAGSTLPNFLVRVRNALPAGGTLVVRHPSPAARRILRLAALPRIAVGSNGTPP